LRSLSSLIVRVVVFMSYNVRHARHTVNFIFGLTPDLSRARKLKRSVSYKSVGSRPWLGAAHCYRHPNHLPPTLPLLLYHASDPHPSQCSAVVAGPVPPVLKGKHPLGAEDLCIEPDRALWRKEPAQRRWVRTAHAILMALTVCRHARTLPLPSYRHPGLTGTTH
jgi:hypothetical protein